MKSLLGFPTFLFTLYPHCPTSEASYEKSMYLLEAIQNDVFKQKEEEALNNFASVNQFHEFISYGESWCRCQREPQDVLC
ncbi:hypothetical protein JG687_00013538 [Phytophthora cactorum]|uniref:Uncharacterized protein n=1 Tax=Phytophthora cactorum TaxID=29920 RepID=A0A8T1TYZ3_9STRA|nr:hypothetical protein JG687_00013538 [Phytophthora cactorum]